eukprot:SAG22_NODE_130_length_18670_cov_12.091379_16_plen_304_part_00
MISVNLHAIASRSSTLYVTTIFAPEESRRRRAGARMESTMQSPPLLLSVLLDRGAKLQPDNEVVTLVEGGKYHRRSLASHMVQTRKLANALTGWGVRRGDRVGTFCWNTGRHLQCYHAIPCMGSVIHTLNIRLSPKELGYIITHAGDRVIIVDEDLLPKLEAVDPAVLDTIELFVVCGTDEKAGGWTTTLPRAVDYDEFIEAASPEFVWPRDLDENSCMGLCYTSGTTGNPKGVAFSQRSTYLHTVTIGMTDFFTLSGADTILSIVPMFHVMSWGLPFISLMLGTKLCMNNRFMDPVGWVCGG